MVGTRKEVDYVAASEQEARERFEREYANSTWRLDRITKVEEIDGYKIAFLEKVI
jgi:hypothetical protein